MGKLQYSFNLPDREDDEEDITDKQYDFIRRLIRKIGEPIDNTQIRVLGKWQASELIDQLIEIRDQQQRDIRPAAKRKQYGCGGCLTIILIVAVMFTVPIYWMDQKSAADSRARRRAQQAAKNTQKHTTSPQQPENVVQELLDQGIVREVSREEGVAPDLYMRPEFLGLQPQIQQQVIEQVHQELLQKNPQILVIVLYDAQTRQPIGRYSRPTLHLYPNQ